MEKEYIGFVLLHEKEMPTIEKTKIAIIKAHGDVSFEVKDSKSSGEIFTKFYELHVFKDIESNE